MSEAKNIKYDDVPAIILNALSKLFPLSMTTIGFIFASLKQKRMKNITSSF